MIEDTLFPPALGCRQCGAAIDDEGRRCASCGHESDPRIGAVIAKRYEIVELLGAGGLGRVYRGLHRELGEPVAIKFLLRQYSSAPELRARFRREAVALAKLRHPGIVSIIDFGEHREELFMVMELVDGATLGSVLEETEGTFPVARLAEIFDQLLQVVETAHAAGIAHRDLKPDNVMLLRTLDRVDRIKVLDFGLALIETPDQIRLTATGTASGTPAYMSPEQCRGEHTGAPSDVYSLGVMLFEALTGVMPFEAADMTSMMAHHMFIPPATMRDVAPTRDISPGLEAVVQAALLKNPSARPTARELRDLLVSAIRGTDAVSLQALAAEGRRVAEGLSRSERVLTRPAARAPLVASVSDDAVVIWASPTARVQALRDTLAMNGFRPTIWSAGETPPAEVGGRAVRVVILEAEPDGAARTRFLRSTEATRKIPVFAIDAGDVTETVELIRAGANDSAARGVDEASMCESVRRLVRRRR